MHNSMRPSNEIRWYKQVQIGKWNMIINQNGVGKYALG